MKRNLPWGLFDFLLKQKYPDAMRLLNSIAARHQQGMYVSREELEREAAIKAYLVELEALSDDELLDMYQGKGSKRRSGRTHRRAEKNEAASASTPGISPKEFTEKYWRNVKGGKKALGIFFRGKTRKQGEVREAQQFQISKGRYDEDRIVSHLQRQGRYSELGFD